MNPRVRFFTIFVALLCFAFAVQANTVYVWPNPNTTNLVTAYDPSSMTAVGSFASGPGPVVNVSITPDGQRRYFVTESSTEAVVVTTAEHAVLSRSEQWNAPGKIGIVTPDGKNTIVLADIMWVFDAATGNQVATVSTGSNPVDVAVSMDSSYALVLSANSQRLYKVDLTSFTVIGEMDINGESTAIAAGPNGLFYVSATNGVRVIDGDALEEVIEIRLTGLPYKMYFTPDGRYGIAANSQTATNASVWVIDLVTNSVAAKVNRLFMGGQIPVRISPRVEIVSNERFFMTSKTNEIIYDVTIPGAEVSVLEVAGGPDPTEVDGIVKSAELPDSKYLFYARRNSLHKVALASDSLEGAPGVMPTPAQGLDYAQPSSSGTPVDAILHGNAQNIQEGEEFRPIAVRALDVNGLPVFNAPVEWTAPAGVTVFGAMASTNKEGFARARIAANDVTGPIPIQCTVGDSLQVTFNLGVGTGGGIPGQTGISIHSGQGQLVGDQFFVFSEPLTVLISNPDGSPAEGETVTWNISQGFGAISAATSSTNEDGLTAIAFQGPPVQGSESWLQSIVTAAYGDTSVDFYITTYQTMLLNGQPAPPPQAEIIKPRFSERDLSGRIGEIQDDAIEAVVVGGSGALAGQPIPNVSLVVDTGQDPALGPWVQCAPTGWAMTEPDGYARCDLQFLGQVGSSNMELRIGGNFNKFRDFTVTVLPGEPTIAAKVGGDGQTGNPGQTLSQQLVVEIQDAARNPLPGAAVLWEVLQAGTVTLSDAQTVTDAGGRASATATLGNIPGNAQVRVTSGAATSTFSLQVLVQATQLNMISGSSQSAVVGTAFGAPLVVQVLDGDGNGVADQGVRFDVTSGSATLGSPTATTDGTGRASMNVTAGNTPGPVTVVASYGNLPPVSFNLAVRLQGPGITPLSFRNGASNAVGVVPGSVVKIVAPGLATNVPNCVVPGLVGELPYELAGVTVQFGPDSAPMMAPIYYVCNNNGEESVAVQAPVGLQVGTVPATVRVQGGATTVENVPVFAVQPGVFETTGANGLRYGVVMRPDGSYVSPANPARRGETLCMFATGLGLVNPGTTTNAAGLPGQEVQFDLVVGVNNEGVRVIGGEYAVNMIGVYAVYFEIPDNSTPGPAQPFALAVVAPDGQLIFGNGSTIAVQ